MAIQLLSRFLFTLAVQDRGSSLSIVIVSDLAEFMDFRDIVT